MYLYIITLNNVKQQTLTLNEIIFEVYTSIAKYNKNKTFIARFDVAFSIK